MKAARVILYSFILCVAAAAATVEHSPARHKLLHEYRHKVLSRQAAGRAAATGAFNSARHYPREWGGGAGGFAKRAGSSFAQHAVAGGIELGVGALHHEDLHYHRSNLQGTWPRLKYAVKSTFIVPRTNKPGKTLATGRIAGQMGGGIISRAWMPASAGGIGAGVASGGIGLGADVGVHVAKEFWPKGKPKTRTARRRIVRKG